MYIFFTSWGDQDRDQWCKIKEIVVHHRSWIHDQSWFIGSFHAPWSEWCWISDPDPDHPKGTHHKLLGFIYPKMRFISSLIIYQSKLSIELETGLQGTRTVIRNMRTVKGFKTYRTGTFHAITDEKEQRNLRWSNLLGFSVFFGGPMFPGFAAEDFFAG